MPLKETVEASIDLALLTKRIDTLGSLIDKVSLENSQDSDIDIDFLIKEAIWSLNNCTSYFEMLKPQDGFVPNVLVALNPEEMLKLLVGYREILFRIIKFKNA